MPALQVIEGLWDEISANPEDLKGKRVRIIVLPDPPTPRTLGDLYGVLKGIASSSPDDIRQAEIEWDWTGETTQP